MKRSLISEPINIVTGALGSGKTLFAIEQADLLRKHGDADHVYQVGINNPDLRKLPALPFPIEEWHIRADAGELKNAVIIVDEFHKWFPQRSQNQRPPKHVEEMAETRRRDVRWILITQSGEFDHFLKGTRLNRHFYISRKSGLGRSTIWEWMNRFVNSPEENETARKVAIRHLWKHPVKAYGDWYESAKAHRFRVRLPLRAWVALAFIPIALFFVWRGISGVGNMLSGGLNVTPPQVEIFAGDDVPSEPGRSQASDQPVTYDLQAYMRQFQALHATLPWSAPAWQSRPVVSDPQIYCMQSGWELENCRCYSDQMTRIYVERQHCETIVRDGIYNPYKGPRLAQVGAAGGVPDGKLTLSARPADAGQAVDLVGGSRGGGLPYGHNAEYGQMGVTP